MVFAEYATILKRHFKKTVANEILCGILFDAIILPSNLKNRNGFELMSPDKALISRIMNRKVNIPKALQEHVSDKKVRDGLENYFEQNIVAELVEDTSDLRCQLMHLIDEDEKISPTNKNKFRLSADQDSISLFLAEAFVYAIRQKNKPVRTSGINPCHEQTLAECKNKIAQLFAEISFPTPEEEICIRFEKNFWSKSLFIGTVTFPVKIGERIKETIQNFAEKMRFTLSADFFYLCGIRRDLTSLAERKIVGNIYGKRKFENITSLVKYINRYNELISVQ